MEESLQQNANIAIIGQPGSGKTVALAYLAAKFARKDESLGPLAETTPLFFHIHEIGNLEAVTDMFDFMVQSTIPAVIGFDEITDQLPAGQPGSDWEPDRIPGWT